MGKTKISQSYIFVETFFRLRILHDCYNGTGTTMWLPNNPDGSTWLVPNHNKQNKAWIVRMNLEMYLRNALPNHTPICCEEIYNVTTAAYSGVLEIRDWPLGFRGATKVRQKYQICHIWYHCSCAIISGTKWELNHDEPKWNWHRYIFVSIPAWYWQMLVYCLRCG